MEEQLIDLGAERAVLSGVFTYGSQGYVDVSDIITTSSFSHEIHQIIYSCLEHILKDTTDAKVDIATIFSAANTLGFSHLLDSSRNPTMASDFNKLLRAITNYPIDQSNVRKMAVKLLKLSVTRNLRKEVQLIDRSLLGVTGDETISYILGLAENPIFDFTNRLSNSQGDGPTLLGDGIDEYLQYLAEHPVDNMGISTGFSLFDNAIGGGLRRGTVNLIGARPKMGKTIFADNVARHVCLNLGLPVLMLDTEMVKNDHRHRICAALSEVTIKDIETGKYAQNPAKQSKVLTAGKKMKGMPYHYLNISGRPWEEIVSVARRWVNRVVGADDNGKTKDCLIIYDYLKLMNAEGINNNIAEHQLLGFQITGLHNFMVKHDIPCLSFIQLNRDGINKEGTDVASQSDRLIWLCSNFTIFKNKSEDELAENPKYNRKLAPIVQRHGEGLEDGDYINIDFKKSYAKMIEGPTRNQLAKQAGGNQGFVVNDGNKQIPFE